MFHPNEENPGAAFRAHMKECQYCREHPCQLCEKGRQLLKRAVLAILYPKPSAPDDQKVHA